MASEQDLLKAFEAYGVGGVQQVHLLASKIGQAHRGAAFVSFVDADSAAKALGHAGRIRLRGRFISIEPLRPKKDERAQPSPRLATSRWQ